MVRMLPAGRLPELQHVAHTNFCDIGFALDPSGERLVIVSLPRQSGQRRGGTGGAKPERDVRISRNGGIDMRMVVKIAGALLEREETCRAIARQIAELARAGHELLVVHGGGKIFTATLARMGIESRFVNGLRVTDRETRDVAVMVFGGLLNKRLAGRDFAGGPAGGGNLRRPMRLAFWPSRCRSMNASGGLGFVGYLTGVNLDFLRSLWRAGIVPGGFLPGPGRRRRALQHQRRPHGRGRRGIYSRRSADFPHGCGRRARRRQSAARGARRRNRRH